VGQHVGSTTYTVEPEAVVTTKGIQSIDNVGVCVTDLARAVDFYETLGFAKAFENQRGCTMVTDDLKLFLFQTRQVNPQAVEREFNLFQNPPGIDHISFLVTNVDEAYAELKARGVQFEAKPADQDRGARVATLRDPDGNNLYLLQWIGTA
jgi:catechol 2,3-dioxygenase-like lactoylglutathione lyase family enzyme